MEYKVKSVTKKIIFAFVIIAAILLVMLSQSNLHEIGEVLSHSVPKYILLALLVLAIYFIINVLGLYILVKYRKLNLKGRDVFLISGTEPFFNGITPFATGGQPFQAYAMYRKGVPLDEATSLLVMNFITFMISTNIFAIFSLIFYQQYISHINHLAWIVIMGFTINFLVLVLMFSLALSKRLRRFFTYLLTKLSNVKCLHKFLDGKVEVFNNYFDGMQKGCMELLLKPFVFISVILTKLISLVFFYSIPYFCLKAVNAPIDETNMLYIILGTSFATTMVVWVPTPGGTGGMELAFNSIFMSISGLTMAITSGGMVLWRLYTYYLLMFVGFVFYLLLEFFDKKQKKKEVKMND